MERQGPDAVDKHPPSGSQSPERFQKLSERTRTRPPSASLPTCPSSIERRVKNQPRRPAALTSGRSISRKPYAVPGPVAQR